MKRRALLLDHQDGELASDKDVQDVAEFLRSCTGGGWLDDEIIHESNITLSRLKEHVKRVKEDGVDYLFFYFSGHGGYVRDTVIELNPQGETISERDVSGLAARQLNIYDCCRQHPDQVSFTDAMDSLKEAHNAPLELAREIYSKRVMEACPQQVSLYACRKGESAYDLGRGGVYTQNLLDATHSFNDRFLLVLRAHILACQPTTDEVAERGEKQHPDYFAAKLPSRYQLPFALNLDIN